MITVKNMARAEKLEQELRCMINDAEVEPLFLLELIDDIEGLGLGYRFRNHISQALMKPTPMEGLDVGMEKNLHASALNFRLLRDHGHEISQDVLKKFKDQNGNFMECLRSDVQGLLSLDQGKVDANIAEQVSHSMELPLLRRMQRLEARWSIQACNKRGDANPILLELAKLDFNLVQSNLQIDLQKVSRWWNHMGLANKLSFARDRMTECFFSAVGVVFEPQLSYCRIGLTKVMTLLSTLDDIYDIYGSLAGLKIFTDAVERWDTNEVETLPRSMKVFFLALYNTIDEIAHHIKKEQGYNIIPHQRKMWADLCKAFLLEAQWSLNKFTPTFKEYIDNAWLSSSASVILLNAYILITENINKDALLYLKNYPDLLRCPSMLFRLYNDLVTAQAEMERGENINSIACYMQEFNSSEKDARDYMSNLIDETWKKMNKYRVSDLQFSKSFIELSHNFARTVQCVYQHGDGHGAPDQKNAE
ncbi:unnamed protein product [Dovyalis caffra]|uniref:Uncharacterized protein n=1 Tax=Dovyalis caffra TaxID=77055 RepID=A0AAV1SHM1_9ROSI|nr:unnamed protein product [Dovyalis caffra]